MFTFLPPAWPLEAPCKCCAGTARLYGLVDFHKNCESQRREVLALSGIPIYYYRCPGCAFLFTTAFDHFSTDDFKRYVYNADYIRVDPEYADFRPRANARFVAEQFCAGRPASVLDFGGGNGVLAEVLRAAGFPRVDIFDPYVPQFAARPNDRYDCVLSFEVVEHSPDPAAIFREMNDLLAPGGIVLFSTLLQPADIDSQGLNWWYVGPRNGHVSLFSQASLLKLLEPLALRMASANDNLHMLYREIPDFARHLIRRE
jgi:2-polyprenyl-6-hydroxyphenyl methylase/3-demethylubiquinone-9 3-methyltransferase